jgi:hypothetical protein
MIDLLLQLAYVALVLAVISLFVCIARLVDRTGGRAFAAVIRSSPTGTRDIGHHHDRDLVPNEMNVGVNPTISHRAIRP